MTYLQNNKVLLRKPEPEDLEFLYNIENNSKYWHLSETRAPYTKWHIRQHIENSNYDIFTSKELRLVIELTENRTSVGIIDIFDFDPHNSNAGLAIIIDEQFRKQGIARDALSLTIEYCFDFLLLHQLYCNIDINNDTSIQLFESFGFKKSGIFTDWKKSKSGYNDVLFYQLINADHR